MRNYTNTELNPVLILCSISVKRQHENSYKGKYFIGACLQFLMINPFSSLWQVCDCASRCGVSVTAETFISRFSDNRK